MSLAYSQRSLRYAYTSYAIRYWISTAIHCHYKAWKIQGAFFLNIKAVSDWARFRLIADEWCFHTERKTTDRLFTMGERT